MNKLLVWFVEMYIWMYYNCLFKTWTNIVIQTKVPYFRPARFWWVFLLVLLVVVVTGVKQSQLQVLRLKTEIWQKNLGKKKSVQKEFRSKSFGYKRFLGPKKGPQKLGPKSLVKIGSVTADIFLIWTNVARTYVALTNVTITVGIC